MKKSLLVIALLALACGIASAQTFGFGTAGGSYLYCNYEAGLTNVFGSPYTVWQAADNLSACGHSNTATMNGISGAQSKLQNPVGFKLKGVTMADNLYDAYSYAYTGAQWDVTQNIKCTHIGARKVVEGWVGWASVSGFVFGDNYGVLACEIPGKGNTPVKGLSTGSAKVAKR